MTPDYLAKREKSYSSSNGDGAAEKSIDGEKSKHSARPATSKAGKEDSMMIEDQDNDLTTELNH